MRPLTRTELAKCLGVAVSTVERWQTQGMPVIRNGDHHPRYDLEACEAWRQERGLGTALRVDAHRRRKADARQDLLLSLPGFSVQECEALGALALLNRDRWLETLREAWLSLPEQQANQVRLEISLWDQLTGSQPLPQRETK
jgi:hypothetical protein